MATTEGIAAKLCDELELNDKSDWFLPSQDEIHLMYDNIQVNTSTWFVGNWYWSSTEDSYGDASVQSFYSGGWSSFSKDNDNIYVRAARAF